MSVMAGFGEVLHFRLFWGGFTTSDPKAHISLIQNKIRCYTNEQMSSVYNWTYTCKDGISDDDLTERRTVKISRRGTSPRDTAGRVVGEKRHCRREEFAYYDHCVSTTATERETERAMGASSAQLRRPRRKR